MPRTTYIHTTKAGFEEVRSRIDARAVTLFAAVFLMVFAIMLVLVAIANANDEKLLPPCRTEDSTHCYWDADTMGNGQGHDFIVP